MLSRWRAGSSGQVRGRSLPATFGLPRVGGDGDAEWFLVPRCGWPPRRVSFRPAAAWVMVLVGLDAFAMAGAAGALCVWFSGARAVLARSFMAEM
jgi:hypothetical protein